MRTNSEPRRQVVPYTVTQYANAGCGQVGDFIGLGIHAVTGGLMCNGCPVLRSGCSAFAKLSAAATKQQLPSAPSETVRQEAERRGISISEVRRQRNASLVSG